MLYEEHIRFLRGFLIRWIQLRKRDGDRREQVLEDLGLIVDEVYRK